MSEQRIKILEEKICYLEDANQQLSDEVIFQKKQLDTFKKTQQDLLDRLSSIENSDNGHLMTSNNEIPPHY